jgi:hypothetical protein
MMAGLFIYSYEAEFIEKHIKDNIQCSVRLYLPLFVGGLVSYLRYLYLFGSSLPPVVCRRARVLFTLFVFVCEE